MSDTNKEIVRRFFEEVWNRGNLEVIEELCAPDFGIHGRDGKRALNVQAHKRLVSDWRTAFPDYALTFEQLIAEGDTVMLHGTGHATHRGTWQGVAATGKAVTATETNIFLLEGGRLTDWWVDWDALGLMRQIGAIPTPAAATA
jgi:steroid delta-isomerase-like uncharacterized protein